jgi:cytochrome P450
MDGWRDAMSWRQMLGTIDEKGGSLLGELSWARISPSSWLPAAGAATAPLSSAASSSNGGGGGGGGSSSSDGGGSGPLLNAVIVAAGVAAVTLVGVGLKSAVDMRLWRRRLRDSETQDAAYGPDPLPFLGNILELRNGYYETLYKFVDKPAAVFWILSTPFVVVNDADCVRTVLGGAGGKYVKPKYFGYRSRAVRNAVDKESGNVAAEAVTYDAGADSSRVALNKMVESSFGTIKSSMDRLTGMMADAAERIDVEEGQEEALTVVRQALVALNLDVLFGMSQKDGDATRAADMIGFAGAEFARRMVNPLRVLVDVPGNLRYLRDVGGLIRLGRRLCAKLDEAVTAVRDGADVLSSAARETLGGGGGGAGLSWVHAWVGKVGKVGKLGKVVGLLMASSQTVPLTAVWMLHLVAKHDDVRERLVRELREIGVRSVGDLTFGHMERMPLAEAVVRETLRLYPPFPLIQRQAQVDDVLGGITVPAGTNVYVVPWLVHRNPKLWPDPHDFKPARFSKGSPAHGDAPSDWAYLPFGRGPRMCAGAQLALVELKVLLALALLRLEWTSACGDETCAPDGESQFPELGMVPKGIRLFVKRVTREMELDAAL